MSNSYFFNDKLVLRTPRLPLPKNVDETLIEQMLHDAVFLEAIYLASPVLHAECKKWIAGTLTDKKEVYKLTCTLAKYYLRMSSRCTPFGLFSGCSVATWNDENTNVKIADNIIRHTRLDMHYLCALAQKLAAMPGIKEHLLYFPNNSIYTMGAELRYIEYYYTKGTRKHQISAVQQTDCLEQILEKAKQGIKQNAVVELLVDDDITPEEALDFFNELIQSQLLVSELDPCITGNEFLFQMIKTLEKIKTCNAEIITPVIELLHDVKNKLQIIDNTKSNTVDVYKEIMQLLNSIETVYDESKLFQTDITGQLTASGIGKGLQAELSNTLEVLNKLTAPAAHTNLQSFIKRFQSRYEDKEMPLVQVLDTETGIGYLEKNSGDIAPLVEDLLLTPKENKEQNIAWNKIEKLLFEKLKTTQDAQAKMIEITDEDVKDATSNWNDLPPSLSIMFRLIDAEKNIIYLESVSGSSAANLLGRFAHADTAINEIVCDIAAQEQSNNEQVLFAEVVHLPESRIGNILLHPAFRKYEIPYLAASSLGKEYQLDVQDLYVSVKNNQVYLRSKRLNKIIVPRLSTAHNYSFNALPVYQFLCDIQMQNQRGGLYFHWGSLEHLHTYLPRVMYKNTILHLAKWKFTSEDIKPLITKDKIASAEAVTIFRNKWSLPREVILADGDNELLIDLDNELSVAVWLETVKNRTSFIFKEFITPVNGIGNKDGLLYNNQLVAAYIKSTAVYAETPATFSKETISRRFAPGSEWLYYKLYCGTKSADKVLSEAVQPLAAELLHLKLIDKWFFIRYNDPDFHLRIRFHLPDAANTGAIIKAVHSYTQPLQNDGFVWKIQADTYVRELERYGSRSIELSESIFYYESIALAEMLALTFGDQREEIRWLWAIRSVDELLNCFKCTVQEKNILLETLRASFAAEFNAGKPLQLQLSNKYRAHKPDIEHIMNKENDVQSELLPLIKILHKRTAAIFPYANELRHLNITGQLEMPLSNLLGSYIHMMLNRVIAAHPRLHEMVIYDFMSRYYQSVIAREKITKKTADHVAKIPAL